MSPLLIFFPANSDIEWDIYGLKGLDVTFVRLHSNELE